MPNYDETRKERIKVYLESFTNNFSLDPNIKSEIHELFKKVEEKDLLRGRRIDFFIYAISLYIIRKYSVPIFNYEIIDFIFHNKIKQKNYSYEFEVTKKEKILKSLRTHYKVLIKEFKLKNNHPLEIIKSFISRVVIHFNLEQKFCQYIEKMILILYKNISIDGKDPMGYLAGIIYLIGKIKNKKITQSKIVEFLGITEVTLRARLKELKAFLFDNFDDYRGKELV